MGIKPLTPGSVIPCDQLSKARSHVMVGSSLAEFNIIFSRHNLIQTSLISQWEREFNGKDMFLNVLSARLTPSGVVLCPRMLGRYRSVETAIV